MPVELSSFIPMNDKILIERCEQESKTPGGIVIPDNAQEKPSKARVVAVYREYKDGETEKKSSLKVGDIVLIAKWGGTECKIDGKEYLVVKESDILGVFGA